MKVNKKEATSLFSSPLIQWGVSGTLQWTVTSQVTPDAFLKRIAILNESRVFFYWLVRQELPSHLLTCLLTRPCRHCRREAWQHCPPLKLSLTSLCHVCHYVYINVYYPQRNFMYLYTCLSHSPHSSQRPLTSTPLHSHKYNLLCLTLDTKTFSRPPVRGCVVFLNQCNGVICPTQDNYITTEPLLHLSLSFIRSQVCRCHWFLCAVKYLGDEFVADRWLMTNFSSSSRSGWAH